MKIVYLDTISINKIFETLYKRVSSSDLKKYIFAISSCQIDELCCIKSTELRSQLVEFLFNISDKTKLKDHIEIMASEALYHLGIEKELDYFDPKHKEYNQLLKLQIKKRIPDIFQENFYKGMEYTKKLNRFDENQMRTTFKPYFDVFSDLGLKKDFKIINQEMKNEGLINKFLFETLDFEKDYLGYEFNKIKEKILQINLSKLNCTYVGLQAKIAYSYLSCFERGKLSQLKESDQVDIRHLFYLNYADIFVTDDSKMHEITKKNIVGIKSVVVDTEGFINSYF